MATSVRVVAPSKVNLHLRVHGRRSDGYHEIRSVFQAVSLADDIVIRSLKSIDTIALEGSFDCPAQDTTIYKAIVVFREASGIRTGLSVTVEKTVPAGAGLGGGSGDAAAVLRALDALFDTRFDTKTLSNMGAQVGSDVPFFFNGGCAIVSGRGEQVEGIASREDFSLVIYFPGVSVSSAEAYRLLDRMRPDDSDESDLSEEELKRAYREDPARWPFVNSFERFVSAQNPVISAARSLLAESGASFSAMSGSGSSVFGVFRSEQEAKAALGFMRAYGGTSYLAFPLARLPRLD